MLFLFNHFILLSIIPVHKNTKIGFIHSTGFSTYWKKLYQPDPPPAERLSRVLSYWEKVEVNIHIQIFVWIYISILGKISMNAVDMSYDSCTSQFVMLQNSLLKRQNTYTSPCAINESSSCSTFLPMQHIVNLLHVSCLM